MFCMESRNNESFVERQISGIQAQEVWQLRPKRRSSPIQIHYLQRANQLLRPCFSIEQVPITHQNMRWVSFSLQHWGEYAQRDGVRSVSSYLCLCQGSVMWYMQNRHPIRQICSLSIPCSAPVNRLTEYQARNLDKSSNNVGWAGYLKL